MHWLEPALAFNALGSALLSLTFLYVWRLNPRQRSVLLWGLAWGAAVLYVPLGYYFQHHLGYEWAWALSQLALLGNALLMVAGCYGFVHQSFPWRNLLLLGVPFAGWSLLAPLLASNFAEATLPSAALLASSHIYAGTCFVRLHRRRHTREARFLAVLFFISGLHELDYPLLGDREWAAPVGYALSAGIAIAIALSLLVMILEESRAEVENERRRLTTMIEALPVGAAMIAPDGTVRLANDLARRLGGGVLTREPLVAAREEAIFRAPDGAALPAPALPLQAALAGQEVREPREVLLQGEPGPRPLLVNASTLRGPDGAPAGAVLALQDIAEHKRMQEEVARSQRLQGLGTLAAGVAHDFNNALTLILGNAELALAECREPAVGDKLRLLSRVAEDAAAIARRIQDVARSRASRDPVVFDLAAVAREVIELSRPRWREEALAVGRSYLVRPVMAGEAPILGQAAEIREALLNLVLNALDAMPSGGELRIEVGRQAGEAVLQVSDTGTGMRPEVRERIFDPFFTTKGKSGNGLGLAIVLGIVERHRGRIEVHSELGRGTTFALRFPLAPTSPLAIRPAPRAEATALRLLVVDDESLVRTLLASMLGAAGHQVVEARSGQEAVDQLGQQDFDIVLTDLGMPGLNGWEVAALTRRLRPAARVVLVTGWGETIAEPDARSSGVDTVLSKPFTRAQLLDCLARVAATVRDEVPA